MKTLLRCLSVIEAYKQMSICCTDQTQFFMKRTRPKNSLPLIKCVWFRLVWRRKRDLINTLENDTYFDYTWKRVNSVKKQNANDDRRIFFRIFILCWFFLLNSLFKDDLLKAKSYSQFFHRRANVFFCFSILIFVIILLYLPFTPPHIV